VRLSLGLLYKDWKVTNNNVVFFYNCLALAYGSIRSYT